MSDSPPRSLTFAVSPEAIRRQQTYCAVGSAIGLLVVIVATIWFLQMPAFGGGLAALVICYGLIIAILVPFLRRRMLQSIEDSLREMHPTISLNEQGLEFETVDEPAIAWDDLWKIAIIRNPKGEARSIQLFPNEGSRILLWDYQRTDELEQALRALIGPHISVEDTTRAIDWENPTILAILMLAMVTLISLAAWLLIQFGLGWLLEIVGHVFILMMGLAVIFLAPATTRSPSAQRKQRFGGFGFILMGISGLLARFL